MLFRDASDTYVLPGPGLRVSRNMTKKVKTTTGTKTKPTLLNTIDTRLNDLAGSCCCPVGGFYRFWLVNMGYKGRGGVGFRAVTGRKCHNGSCFSTG